MGCEPKRKFGLTPAGKAAAMTKCLIYIAPIALIGLAATEAPATPAVWSGGMARDIVAATAVGNEASLVLLARAGGGRGGGFRGGGGGGYRGGGGGFAGGGVNRGGGSWAGVGGASRGDFNSANVNRGNISTANINRGNINTGNVYVNRNVNVSGGGYYGGRYYGPGWGGVAAGVAAGAVVGAAAASTPYYYSYPTAPAPTVWYWCDPYQGYYPSVPECPVPWREVVQ